jgi:hypothetical protein
MTTTPEPVGEHDGVPQYAQATMADGALIVASTPPAIGPEPGAEPEPS